MSLRRIAVGVVLILLGVSVLLYPVILTQWNNWQQKDAARTYENVLSNEFSAEELAAERARAVEYNNGLGGLPILDPWESRVAKGNAAYEHYSTLMNSGSAMGRLIIPRIRVDLPIYHGTSEETLHRGIGHLYGTSLPVGGEGTRAVLTGHSGLRTATLLDNLGEVSEGDAIYVQSLGTLMKYEVTSIEVVLPDDTERLRPVPGEDLVTVVTCTPYGINTHRLLVTGHRVPLDPAESELVTAPGGWHLQWWMWVLIVGVLLVLGLMIARVRRLLQQ